MVARAGTGGSLVASTGLPERHAIGRTARAAHPASGSYCHLLTLMLKLLVRLQCGPLHDKNSIVSGDPFAGQHRAHLPSWGSAERDVQPEPGHISARVTGSPGLQPRGLATKIWLRRVGRAACVLVAHCWRDGREDQGKSAARTDLSRALARAGPRRIRRTTELAAHQGPDEPEIRCCQHRAGAHARTRLEIDTTHRGAALASHRARAQR